MPFRRPKAILLYTDIIPRPVKREKFPNGEKMKKRDSNSPCGLQAIGPLYPPREELEKIDHNVFIIFAGASTSLMFRVRGRRADSGTGQRGYLNVLLLMRPTKRKV